jgi:hypothetical protein
MAAPTNAANVKKALANSEPSTHGSSNIAAFAGAPVGRISGFAGARTIFFPIGDCRT